MEPFHDLGAQYRAHREEIDRAIREVLESGRYILGAAVDAFEQGFAAWLGAGHAIAVSSGTSAIELALRALGIAAGDEVIVPAMTAPATAMAVWTTGATPRIVDVGADASLDPEAVRAAIGPRTRAIVAVHLWGHPADMAAIESAAGGIPTVEDAAHAHGAAIAGRKVGTIGRLGCFSFYPTKNLGGYGDGGAVVTNDDALAARVRRLRVYGADGDEPGPNARMEDLHAAILSVKLRRLDAWNERRRAIAARYRAGLAGARLVLPAERAGTVDVYHQFVVRSPARDALRAHLAARGVDTRIHYPEALHEIASLRGVARADPAPIRAAAIAREVLSLPIFPEISDERVARTIDAVREHLE